MITDDGRGLARGLENQLLAAGVPVERIGGPESPIDWTSPAAIDAVLDRLRSQRSAGGDRSRTAHGGSRVLVVTGSRRLVRPRRRRGEGALPAGESHGSGPGSRRSRGGACLIAATALGGRLASDGCDNTDFFPGQGGIAGLVKTLAREWPAVRARVVDFPAGDPIATVADRLVAEMFVRDGWAEVGYDQGRRIRLQTIESPLEQIDADARAQAGRPRADFRRSPGHHRPGGGRTGTALAADTVDRRHDAIAR